MYIKTFMGTAGSSSRAEVMPGKCGARTGTASSPQVYDSGSAQPAPGSTPACLTKRKSTTPKSRSQKRPFSICRLTFCFSRPTQRTAALELPETFYSFEHAPNCGVSSGQCTLRLLWVRLVPGDHGGCPGEMWGAHRNGVFAVRYVTIAESQTNVRVDADDVCNTKLHNSRSAVAKSTP